MLEEKIYVKKKRNIIIVLISLILILGIYIKVEAIELGYGTIKPIYRPEWEIAKDASGKQKVYIDKDAKTMSIEIKGTANESQTLDSNAKINYLSNVTTTLVSNDITVYIDGEEAPNIKKLVSTADPSTETEVVTHTITLSEFNKETTRQDGKNFLEWAGNISIKIAGRGEDASTYTANKLYDIFGNQNMMETDEDEADGTWIDIILEDQDATQIDKMTAIDESVTNITTTTPVHMFTDFIKPEFTYAYSTTNPDINITNETVTVVFDVTDKYFESTTLATNANGSLITVIVDEDENANTPITKALSKIKDVYYDETAGVTYVNSDATGTGTKVGERYQLVITGLDQEDGFNYSGPLTLSFPSGVITDKSGNTNNATSITMGVNEPDGEYGKPGDLFDSNGTNQEGLHIGDFIEYDAGIWTQTQIDAIQTGEIANPVSPTGTTSLPGSGYQFGGFAVGSSRNENVTPYSSTYNHVKDKSTGAALTGWRVFDIEDGKITLISAGNPEAYRYPYTTNGAYSGEYVLTGNVNSSWNEEEAANYQIRNWDNYINTKQKAESAKVLTKSILDSWYSKYITASANTYTEGTFQMIYEDTYAKYQNIVDNYSYYYYGDAQDQNSLFYYLPDSRKISPASGNRSYGVRLLVTLSADVEITKAGTKTVTGGNTTTYGGDQTYNCWTIKSEGQIVDVVDPVWEVQNLNTTTDANGNVSATMDLIGTDKFFKQSTLTSTDIQIKVDGVEDITSTAPDLVKTLGTAKYIKLDESGNYIETTVDDEEAIGVKYEFSFSGLKETDATFFANRANYNDDDASTIGRPYREYSGDMTIVIPAGKLEDDTGNTNNKFEIPLDHVDTLKPEVIKVSGEVVPHPTYADNAELSTYKVVFDIVDKYINTSSITTTDTSKIHIYLDGEEAASMTKPNTEAEQVANSDKIFKKITSVQTLTDTIDGETQTVGYRYTLELSKFEVPRTIDYDREYTDWSGDLSIKIEANTATDTKGTGNEETILYGNEANTTVKDTAAHVDLIKPDATYEYSSVQDGISDVIDKDGKTYTMVFDITDKFFQTATLSISDFSILMSAEEETGEGEDEDGYDDLMSNARIGKAIEVADITNDVVVDVVNGENVTETKVIGKRYTLRLSNLQQLQKIENDYYLDYSGIITITIPANKVIDSSGNGNDITSITSGIDIPGGEVTDFETVDVVAPIWERTSVTTDIHNQTATITIEGTDKYFYEHDDTTTTDDDGYGTLTLDEIKLLVNGAEVTPTTGDIVLSEGSKLYEQRIVQTEYGDGEVDTGYTTETVQYGIGYTITIKNFDITKKQVKIQLTEGSLVDESGNESNVTDIIVYNTLKTATYTIEGVDYWEDAETDGFLGNTSIQRQNIEQIVFVSSLDGDDVPTTIDGTTCWDVSAQRDNSILAWWKQTTTQATNGVYTVCIGSNDDIYGNYDSSYLFSYIGYSSNCTESNTISGLDLLDTRNVSDMSNMFQYCGYDAMTELVLSDSFDTTNVTTMNSMFKSCGYKLMTNLTLSTVFNTSEVTDMSYMFQDCGYGSIIENGDGTTTPTGMLSLDLSAGTDTTNTTQFNTSSVTTMQSMFENCGYIAMTSLDLGTNFNTSSVTNMQSMFSGCGYTAMTSLDLSSGTDETNTTQFNTSNVTNMSYMFQNCGYGVIIENGDGTTTSTGMTSLKLGNNFDTSKVSTMQSMFSSCGYSAMESLDLGSKFDTSEVENMQSMFSSCGYNSMTTLKLGSQFNTSQVTKMAYMFTNCGYAKLTSLDLGNLFYTANVTSMYQMFYRCGYTEMESLDLGPAFTNLASNAGVDGGKSGCIIYAPESIYSSRTAFKLNSTSTTTINYTQGTINPIYRPKWAIDKDENDKQKVYIDTTDETNKKMNIVLKGTATETLLLEEDANGNVTSQVNYTSNVTSALTAEDILVYINGELDNGEDLNNNGVLDAGEDLNGNRTLDKPSIQKEITPLNPETASQVTQTLTLSGFEEAIRRTGLPFKELSGNIKIKIGGRGQATSTYDDNDDKEKTLVDEYGNRNMMETDELDGTWLDVTYENDEKDKMTALDESVTEITTTTPVYMFTDYIHPEFTYKSAETVIGNGNNGDTKKVTLTFEITDKYFNNTTLTANDITLSLIDTDPATTIDPANITKTLTKTHDIIMNSSGTVTYQAYVEGSEYTLQTGETKVGEKYELLIEGLEQRDANGFSDGYTYSGPMSITFPSGKITDKSGNVNNATTITIGVDETDGNEESGDSGSQQIVDVVDPVIIYNSSSIDRTNNTATLTIKAIDKYLSTETLDGANEAVKVRLVYQDENGVTQVTEDTTIATEVTKITTQSEYMIFRIQLTNFGVYEGETSVIIPPDVIKDLSGNGNKETVIEVDKDGDGSAFEDGIVDFTKPTWEYVTSSIQRNRAGETGTVTLEIKGTDIYFDEKYYNDEAYQLDLSTVKAYVNNVHNTAIDIDFATKPDGSIAKEYIEEAVELADGYTRLLKGVKYTLILSDFGTNEGAVKIEIPANAIKDTSLNGNIATPIDVGNPYWLETDVDVSDDDEDDTPAIDENGSVSAPKYTAFRNDIVDYIKPVIKYQYVANTNPLLDRTAETVDIIFTATDTNFLESNIGLEDMKIYIDNMQVYGEGASSDRTITPILSTPVATAEGDGLQYTLKLSVLELNRYLGAEIFERHSGIIKIVFAADQVADTSGNKNIETTIIIDNDNGDDQTNGVIVDFINPNIYYKDKYINWEERYALITLRATDRFYNTSTALQPSDLTLYEQNDDGNWINITNNFTGKIVITKSDALVVDGNTVGYDYTIRLNDFEEEFKMKINIKQGAKDASGNVLNGIGDTSGNLNDSTDILVDLDNKKPHWQYVSTDTSNFESAGTISFNVKGVDKFLNLTNSGLANTNINVLRDGTDITNVNNITVTHTGDNETEKSKAYKIDVTGLTEMGTYSLVFAKETLVDEFNNKSAATTITFSNAVIASNTGNYVNVTYHVTPDMETVHKSYVHELMSVNTTGTNFENTTYRPSALGELFNNGENPLFAEPMYVPSVDGYTIDSVYAPKSFAGWAEADEKGNAVTGGTVYGLYDEIPKTITHLKAVWQNATVVFVSTTNGNNSNDGKLPTTPVKDLTTAYSKINSSGTAENNIIVIMDEVEFSSTSTLSGNATITSIYAGIDYRTTNNAELKLTTATMTVNGDIIFDDIELYTTNNTILVSNYSGDITIGRGITTPSANKTFDTIIGGNLTTETSTSELGTHTIRIEAGKYDEIIAGSSLTSSTTTTKSVTHELVIGNMRDTAVSRNSKLTITEGVFIGKGEQKCYPSGTTSDTLAAEEIYANVTLYSGTFTENSIIYLRSLGGQTDGLMNFEMYGGNITGNIYGGSRIGTRYGTQNYNTMNFYGGQLTGNIFGQGQNDIFTGGSTITLQGNFNMTGNIYGGSEITTTISNDSVGNSIITVNSSSTTVNGNIYGGSKATDGSTSYVSGNVDILLEAGTVSNIYGSGYNSGIIGTIDITIENGVINENIFGGAYHSQVKKSSNIIVLGGTVNGNIYGGNNNDSTQLDGDAYNQDTTNITIGDTDETVKPTVNGVIYGGGKYDKVETATIQLIECANVTSVYGGSDTNATTVTANIYLKGMTVNEIYGGGQSAGTVAVANIYLQSGTATEVYGGGYSADVTESNISLEGSATVTSIYGGSNTSGTVTTSNVTLKSGSLTNVFGGGNSASVGTANVTLDGITIDKIHGGSKDAGLTTTTNVTLKSGTVGEVFGGGLDVGATTTNVKQQGATVTTIYGGNNSGTGTGGETGTTNVEILNSTVANVYGGNKEKGTTRYANINIHGTSTITGNVYGGGYKSEIGKSGETGSTTINIAGGTINGDINGGSELSTVYGNTNINIGQDATVSVNSSLTPGNINIIGIIYGAGSTETAGTITVVGNTNITMDNSTNSPITYLTADGDEKSIYGSGKGGAIYSNGTTTDQSTIHIKDVGTSTTPYLIKSIEDTGSLYIGSSVVELSGALDVPNDPTKVGHYYTLNTITNALTIYSNTTLYTQRGFNKVGGYYSYVNKNSTKASVSITDGVATPSVDNRIYTLEGINLIFAKKEVTLDNKSTLVMDDWGEVTGMTYFGTYKNTSTGKQYDLSLFKAGTYVEGQYNSSHNVNVDGFYTTILDGATEKSQIIDTINYTYYTDWIINAPTINYDVDLVASAYGKQSVAELVLDYIYASDYTYKAETIYTLSQISTNALKPDIELVDPSDPTKIPTISANANTKFGLTMETAKSGWKEQALTKIYSASNGSYAGDSVYKSDAQTLPGTIKFKIHNSLNITEEKDLGNVNIILTGQQPIGNAAEAYTFKVAIAVNMQAIVDKLKAQYTPSFTDSVDTELSYTTDSRIDLSYLLYKDMATTPYATGDYRVLSTTEKLPAGTRITMKDYGQGDSVNKVYYYHVTGAETETDGTRYLYRLSNFLDIGSINDTYADIESNIPYYNSTGKYVLEKYDISIDFIDSGINANKLAQETYLELRNSSSTVKYNNGDTTIKYNLYSGKNAIATENDEDETIEGENKHTILGKSYSVVESIEIPFKLNVSILEQAGIKDTKYYDKTAGIAIQIVGENGIRIKSPELQNFKLTNTTTNEVYQADTNGVIRMPIIEGLGSKSDDYKLTVSQSNVSPGLYTGQIILYTADDGKYYGTEPELEPLEFNITFISRLAGALGVEAEEESRVINKSTGLNLVEGSQTSNAIDMTIGINNPTNATNIRVELYKRNPTYTSLTDETTYTGTSYTLVDITKYLQGTWTESTVGSKEYVISPKKTYDTEVTFETLEFERAVVEGINTGEYKLVFKAYSDDTLVQTFSKTFIVTP